MPSSYRFFAALAAFCLPILLCVSCGKNLSNIPPTSPAAASPAWSLFPSSTSFLNPNGVCSDPSNGNLWVADTANGRVVELNPSGAVVTQYSNINSSTIVPFTVAMDSNRNLYISDNATTPRVIVLNPNGGVVTILAGYGATAFQLPRGMALDSSNNLYVADYNRGEVFQFTSAFAPNRAYPSLGPTINFVHPWGMATDFQNDLYVTDVGKNAVYEFNIFSNSLAQYTSAAGLNLNFPEGVAVDPSGNIFIADTGNDRLVQMAPNGASQVFLTEFAGIVLNEPSGLFETPVGTLYLADWTNNRILKYTP